MENKKKVGRPKGQKKTGGRQKGTSSKTTANVRTWLNKLIDDNRQQIENDLKELEPKDRLQMLERFLQYTTPKMSNVKQEIDFNNLSEDNLDLIIDEITKDLKDE